jgi:putative ABC transport system ATP-binding protein
METTPPTTTTQDPDVALVARVENLSKSYGTERTKVDALREVSLGIRRGEFTAIMGPSGSGKSTLMHIMAGLDSPTSGRVWLGDAEIGSMDDAQLTVLRRRRVGFVFQSFNLVPTLDVEGNLLLPFELDGRRPTTRERDWI